MKKRLTFTNWAPDAPEVDNPTFEIIEGWPGPVGYREPLAVNPAYANTSATTLPTGIGPAIGSSGLKYMFWATQDRLFKFSATSTTTDVTGTVLSITTPVAGGRTEFVQWGNKMIATNGMDAPQILSDLSGSTFANIGTATAVPKMKTITSSRNFLIGGNTHDPTDGTSPQRVRWSAINDETDWTVSASTQSDFQDLLGPGGSVKRIIGGENAIVFMESAIYRMTYVGSPAIWQFDEISTDRGIFAPGAAAKVEDKIFFLSRSGFYVLSGGNELIDIGSHRVNAYFFKKLHHPSAQRISCAVSNNTSRVFWNFPTDGAGATSCMVYDYRLDKWGQHTAETNGIIASALADSSPSASIGVDDSIAEARNTGSLSGIGFRKAISSARRGRVKTGWIELEPGFSSMIKSLQPGIRQRSNSLGNYGSNYFLVSSVRSGFGSTATTKTAGTQTAGTITNDTNRYSIRKNGRYHQIEYEWYSINETGDSTHLLGDEMSYLDVEYVKTHQR